MDIDYYNGTEPVYKTYDFLKKKKITYTFWDTIEPSKSIIEFKKSIQFKHDKPIKYFIYKNTRKYTVFDSDTMYEVDRWQINADRIKKVFFASEIHPVFFDYIYVGWAKNKWLVYSEDLYETECPHITPLFIKHIPHTSQIGVFTSEGIYRIDVEFKSVSSAVVVNTDIALHAVTYENKLIYSTKKYIKIYDTISWTIAKEYNVRVEDFDCYKNDIWGISDSNLWYSKDKWFKLPLWHLPDKIRIIDSTTFITQSSDNVVVWSYIKGNKVSKHYIHASGHLYIRNVIPFEHSNTYYIMDNKEMFCVEGKNILYINFSLEQPEFIWPEHVVRWINDDEDVLNKDMLNKKSLEMLEKTVPVWMGLLLGRYESNEYTWEPELDNISDVLFLLVKYDNIKIAVEDFMLDYFIDIYNTKKITASNMQLLVDLVFSIKMSSIFSVENIHKSIKIPDCEFDFMFLNYTMQEDDYEYFTDTLYLKIFNENINISYVKYIILKIQYHIKTYDMFVDNPVILEIIHPELIDRTMKLDLLNEWVNLFYRVIKDTNKVYDFYPDHLDSIFRTFVKYVCNVNTIRMFYYPNDNDGSWETKKFTELKNKDWVLSNNVIYRASQLTCTSTEDILTWVNRKKSPKNSLERCLFFLNKENWQRESVMEHYVNQFVPIGMRVLSPNNIEGIIVDFNKKVRLKNGETCELDHDWKIQGHQWNYYIDPSIRYKAESWIQHALVAQEDIHIPTEYKKSCIQCLRPTVFNVEMVWDHISGVTVINMDKSKNLWIGFRSGIIVMMAYENFLDSTHTYKGHWKDIRSIQFFSNMFVSSSSDREIRIWDKKTKKCIKTLKGHNNGVEKAYFIDRDFILSIDRNQTLKKWAWKTSTCYLTMELKGYNYTLHRPILNMPITMHMPTRDRSLIICDRGLYMFMNDKISSCEINTLRISSFTLSKTTNTILVGTTSGKIYVYQIEDSVTELHTKKISDVPLTCIKILDEEEFEAIIGSEDGYIFIYSVYPNLIRNTINVSSMPIMNIIYRIGEELFIRSGDNKILYCSYDIERPEQCCKIISKIMKKTDWNNVVKRYIPSIVKKLLTDITLFKKQSNDIFDIIYKCIEDVNDRKSWCEKSVLDMLLLHVNKPNPLVKKIITKLFCFQGKTFKCSLCLGRSTSPRRWPISFISSCSHRFHKKCLEEHIKKTAEWNDDCLQNWALSVTLQCPLCKINFTHKDVKDDPFVSEVCQYDSSQED